MPTPALETNQTFARPAAELQVGGMTCNNCARKVMEAVRKTSGIHSVSANVQSGRATVRWNSPAEKNVPAVVAAITGAGFAAKELTAPQPGEAPARQSHWQWNLILGLSVTGSLMTGEWILGLGMAAWFQWLAFGLAGVVQTVCGAQFYAGAWRQLKVGASNMDTLVALGSTTAFGYSTWVLLSGAGGHLYFMEAAAIISLISTGHWFEARVSDQAGGALRSLLTLAPATARKLVIPATTAAKATVGTGFNLRTSFAAAPAKAPVAQEVEVAVAELQAGDRVVLKPGDRVPVDGVVWEGESAVDEAMLTGESIPADKKNGSELFAGTVNVNGPLVMQVRATGEGTALAQIIAAVQRAQGSRANVQRLGDSISNVFVPVIVGIALAAGLWWGLAPDSANRVHAALAAWLWHSHLPGGGAAGFIIAAAVLIVACPCAMGLATPAAIMASANAAARRGILIRDGIALEKAGEITAIVFDKTGTLTRGKPEVAAELALSRPAPFAPRELAAAMARHSNHPISQALAKLSSAAIALGEWQEVRGSGIAATLATGTAEVIALKLGSLNWLAESGVELLAGQAFAAEWSGQGATIVGLAAGETLLALFAVRDALKPNAAKVVSQLQAQGLKTYLLTGDNALTAASIARQVGIATENVFAGVRPEAKAGFIKQLQDEKQRVAFVGDGINDAPALTQADLGIAVSRASDVAREAADIILLKSEIEAVPEALGLARATLRTIKQNLFWAFFYNALGVPLAALGFISPVVCAAAMGFSDLIVIGNALRLLRWRAGK